MDYSSDLFSIINIVRGEATNNLLSNSAARQSRRHSNAFARPRKKGRDEIGQGNYVRGSGKCTNISNPSKSKPYYHCHSQEELGPNDSCSYEDGYSSVKMKSGFSSFSQNSEAKLPFSGSKIWTEDPSSELPVAGLDIDAKSSFDRSKYAERLACSPSGSFISEKFTFHDSLIFSKDEFGPTISPDSKLKGTPPDSLHLAGSHGETPFPDAEESASRDVENEAKIQPARCKKLELIEEICNGNGLFSENKKAIDASSSGKNNCGCKEENDESPEVMQNLETTYSPDHAEQVSMSLLISKKLGSIIEEQEYVKWTYFSSCYCVIVFCSLAQKVHILLEPTRLKWLHLLPDIIMAMKLLFHVRMGIKVCFCRPFSHELHSQNSYRIFEVRNLF
jgi:hypothetical protein